MSKRVVVYGADWCNPCINSQNLLVINKIKFEFIDVEKNHINTYGAIPVTKVLNDEEELCSIVGELEEEDVDKIKGLL